MRSVNPVAVVATCKSTFAGAATIKSRFLRRLDQLGIPVTLVAQGVPPALRARTGTINVRIVDSGGIRSASPANLELLQAFLVEELVEECREYSRCHRRVVLWGSHLFPYGAACLQAKRILMTDGLSPFLVLFPVGADIWEISPRIPSVTRSLLRAPEVDALATYSEQFAREIRSAGAVDAEIHIVPPFLLPGEFDPPPAEARQKMRREEGIREDALVLINHSNMRPVKRIDFVIELAGKVARYSERPVWLILLGPRAFPVPAVRNVQVLAIDTIDDVADYLRISDFAVNASLHDAFNTALLEAMSCGVVPVTSGRPAISGFIENAGAGVVFRTREISGNIREEIEGAYPIEPEIAEDLARRIADMRPDAIGQYRANARRLLASTLSLDAGTAALRCLLELAL